MPGVTLTKWTSIWAERFPRTPLSVLEVTQAEQRTALDDGRVDVCFVRLPIDSGGLHVIPLYEEAPVVWVSKEHPIAAFDAVTAEQPSAKVLISLEHHFGTTYDRPADSSPLLSGETFLRGFAARVGARVDVQLVDVAPLQWAFVGVSVPAAPRKWDEAEVKMDEAMQEVAQYISKNKLEALGLKES